MKKLLTVCLLLTFISYSSFGSGYQVLLQGNRTTGMGNLGVMMYSDASSLFFNPGAMGFMDHNSVLAGFNPIFASNSYWNSESENSSYTANSDNPMGTPLVAMSVITAEDAEKRKVNYAEGINPVLIEDKDLDDLSTILGTINPALALYGQTRQSNSTDILLLTAQFEIGELADPGNPLSQIGVVVPLGDEFALTPDEINNIETYTNVYNQIIRSYASAGTIGVFESSDALNDLSDGVYIDGVSMDGSFITGGGFSLDGVHPTPRGYAYIANKMIEEINSEFGASLSPVILNAHRAVILP